MDSVAVPSKVARYSIFIYSSVDYEKHTHLDREEGGEGKQSERVFLLFLLNHCAVYILKAHACKNIVSNQKLVLRPRTRVISSVPHSTASCVGVSEPEK